MFTIWFKILTFLVLGFILLLIELFTPTFGVVGLSGIILIITGCYLAVTLHSVIAGITLSLSSLIIIIASIKLFPKTRIAKSMRLSLSQDKASGYNSADDSLKYFMGKEGVAVTILRPSGTAIIDGKKVDVITEGIFMPEGSKVRVMLVEGSRVVVKSVERI
jgi:membrane-bound serine protease (ClpP class)